MPDEEVTEEQIERMRRRLRHLEERIRTLEATAGDLREREAQYREIIDGMADIIATFDLQGRFRSVNRAVRDMLGYEPEDLIGRPVEQLIRQDLRDQVAEHFRCVAQGESIRSEATCIHRDGHDVQVEYSASPVYEDGKIVGVQSTTWDVTERKTAQMALRDSEGKYRTLVESAGEAIATIDRDGVFLFLNVTAARRIGGKPEDLVGKTMWDLFPKEVADRQAASIREVVDSGKGMNLVVSTRVQAGERWYNTTLEPIRDSQGRVLSVLMIARDVHELKEAENTLKKYRERMVRAERLASLGTLSATLAHELNQPLTVIRLSIQNALAQLGKTGGHVAALEGLQDGLSEIAQVTAIVDRFRNFARKSSEAVVQPLCLETVAQRIARLLNESARHANVTMDLQGLDDLPLVQSNEKDIEQLFFALASNAIQAADGTHSRRLIISGTTRAHHVELAFQDDCGGIDPDHRDRIFEPFFTTKPLGEGTGLGLCIVQSIVERAGGKVWVESAFGEGSTFYVRLPLTP